MNYKDERTIREVYGCKMGFDYLPSNYDTMDRHKQNNVYMIAMWENDNSYLEKAIEQYEQLQNLETGICYNN